jgi:hypothetical protein
MKDSKFLTNLPNGSTSHFRNLFFRGGGSCFLLEEYGKKCTERQSETKATGESKQQPKNFFIIRHIRIIFCSSKGNCILVRGSTVQNSAKFMLVGIFRFPTTFSLRASPNSQTKKAFSSFQSISSIKCHSLMAALRISEGKSLLSACPAKISSQISSHQTII